ncbi:MAG: hypothetical protein R6X03_04300, partial [Methyloceanibacter sp.]
QAFPGTPRAVCPYLDGQLSLILRNRRKAASRRMRTGAQGRANRPEMLGSILTTNEAGADRQSPEIFLGSF